MNHCKWRILPFFNGGIYVKKLLIIMNPVAGVKKSNKHLAEIISLFCENGYECQVQMTTKEIGADKIAEKYAFNKDLVVCIGGDGTFNELVTGIIKNNYTCNVGYIPSGSTNDFAGGIGISVNPIKAAKDILNGKCVKIDVGLFNDRIFTYTAAFGAFTKTSYNTPRDLKNSLGYLAYVLEGIKELTELQAFNVKIESENKTTQGKYIYGGICNSRQIGGGFVKFSKEIVNMSDGLFEILLIKYPKNPAELMGLLMDLNANNYTGSMFEFFSATNLVITTNDDVAWTIDGEFEKGSRKVEIKNLNKTLNLVLNNEEN